MPVCSPKEVALRRTQTATHPTGFGTVRHTAQRQPVRHYKTTTLGNDTEVSILRTRRCMHTHRHDTQNDE